ncbi:unnamed protein product, partial [Polarella glacialis]
PGSTGAQNLLPGIPQSARGRTPQGLEANIDFRGYQLGPNDFPSWPPQKISREEKDWYAMARDLRKEAPPTPPAPRQQEPLADAFSANRRMR